MPLMYIQNVTSLQVDIPNFMKIIHLRREGFRAEQELDDLQAVAETRNLTPGS